MINKEIVRLEELLSELQKMSDNALQQLNKGINEMQEIRLAIEKKIMSIRTREDQLQLIAERSLEKLPCNITTIYNAILSRNKLTIYQLFHEKNETQIVMCRHEIHYILRDLYGKRKVKGRQIKRNYIPFTMSLKQISSLTGKDHATIINSTRVINNEMDTKKTYYISFQLFFNKLKEENPEIPPVLINNSE